MAWNERLILSNIFISFRVKFNYGFKYYMRNEKYAFHLLLSIYTQFKTYEIPSICYLFMAEDGIMDRKMKI